MAKENKNEVKRGEAPEMQRPSIQETLTEFVDLGHQIFEKLQTIEDLVEIIAREIARQIGVRK